MESQYVADHDMLPMIMTPDTLSIRKYRPFGPFSSMPTLSFGWGERPAHGDGSGEKYLSEEFTAIIAELVQQGNAEKGQKHSVHQMQSEIMRQHPDRYDIPSTIGIATNVSAQLQEVKKNKAVVSKAAGGANGSEGAKKRGRPRKDAGAQGAEAGGGSDSSDATPESGDGVSADEPTTKRPAMAVHTAQDK